MTAPIQPSDEVRCTVSASLRTPGDMARDTGGAQCPPAGGTWLMGPLPRPVRCRPPKTRTRRRRTTPKALTQSGVPGGVAGEVGNGPAPVWPAVPGERDGSAMVVSLLGCGEVEQDVKVVEGSLLADT